MPNSLYNIDWPDAANRLDIELKCFEIDHVPKHGGLGRYQHFLNVVRILWPYHPTKKKNGVIIHPWAELMWEEASRNKYLGISGPKSSAKTESFALWALVSWLCSPRNTLVLVTSTSMKEARKRIWGAIRERYLQVPGLPGKLVDSMGIIRLDDSDPTSDRASISLIPSSPEKEKEATAKLIGLKQKRVILIGDEMTDISSSVVEACYNLDANPYFQFIALGNFKSLYDPFGQFVEPKDGWKSVTVEHERWNTKMGLCLHLDGTKSPNIYNDDQWPFLYRKKSLEEAIERGEENTVQFWRFVRSFPAPSGSDDTIYSEAAFRKFDVMSNVVWKGQPTKIAGFDPSFSDGGDHSVLHFAEIGMNDQDLPCIQWTHFKKLMEDVTQESEPRSYQIAEQVKAECQAEGVLPENLAVDATGAGNPWCDVLEKVWSNRFLRVKFGGKPSELQIFADKEETAQDLYDRRVTELWYVGIELMKTGQLKGMHAELAKQLCERKYETTGSKKLSVETKKDMKMRIGKSPDEAEAALLAVEVARVRFGLMAGGTHVGSGKRNGWQEQLRSVDPYSDQFLVGTGGGGFDDYSLGG